MLSKSKTLWIWFSTGHGTTLWDLNLVNMQFSRSHKYKTSFHLNFCKRLYSCIYFGYQCRTGLLILAIKFFVYHYQYHAITFQNMDWLLRFAWKLFLKVICLYACIFCIEIFLSFFSVDVCMYYKLASTFLLLFQCCKRLVAKFITVYSYLKSNITRIKDKDIATTANEILQIIGCKYTWTLHLLV